MVYVGHTLEFKTIWDTELSGTVLSEPEAQKQRRKKVGGQVQAEGQMVVGTLGAS